MPETSQDFMEVQDSHGVVHQDRWTAVLYIEDKGEFRHVVENEHKTLTGVVIEDSGTFTFTAGPTPFGEAEAAATGILFNRGSSVQCLKAICARFLVLMSRLRTSQKPLTLKNQKDEGV